MVVEKIGWKWNDNAVVAIAEKNQKKHCIVSNCPYYSRIPYLD